MLASRDHAAPGGADLTFATGQATNSQSERQIQSSTKINILLVVLLIPTFVEMPAESGYECWNRTTSPQRTDFAWLAGQESPVTTPAKAGFGRSDRHSACLRRHPTA